MGDFIMNIFEQSFDDLMKSVGVQATPQPTEPAQTQVGNVFEAPKVEVPKVEEPKDDYRVDMDIFGAQVDPAEAEKVITEAKATPQPEPTPEPTPQPEPTPEPKPEPKPKTKAKTKKASKSEPLIDEDTVVAIETEIATIVSKAVRKAILGTLQDISSKI